VGDIRAEGQRFAGRNRFGLVTEALPQRAMHSFWIARSGRKEVHEQDVDALGQSVRQFAQNSSACRRRSLLAGGTISSSATMRWPLTWRMVSVLRRERAPFDKERMPNLRRSIGHRDTA